MTTPDLWAAIHAERAALADDLSMLEDDAWASPSLCDGWTVEDVTAHLASAATIGRFRWMASIIGARFNADRHNQRRMIEQRGRTPAETLERFRSIVDSTTAASGHTPAWLGEVIVHAADIRWPQGIEHTTPIDTVTAVARFYAGRDFTVSSASAIKGLRLEATDGPFTAGDGPLVSGPTFALTMAMAGRRNYLADLAGPGLPTLRTNQRDGSGIVADET